jgi:methylglutaconyl-CoA hydratase
MNSANLPVLVITVPAVLNPETIGKMSSQLALIDVRTVRFLILRGSPQVFCNGLDIHWIAHNEITETTELNQFSRILTDLHSGPWITIAVVEGEVTGGGMGILAACDFVLATNGSQFALTEGMLGFIPGIILPFLLDKISATAIKKMVFTGQKYPAETMMAWGMVHEVVASSQLESAVTDVVRSMKSCKPQAITSLKTMLSEADCRREELIQEGIKSLIANLGIPSVKERLESLSDYLGN